MSFVKVTLEYADTPPTYNSYQRAHWAKQGRIKYQWQGIFEGLLRAEPMLQPGGFLRCEAWAELRFPTERRRDAGNYQTPIEKSLGDALVNGGWLSDDTHSQFRFGDLRILPKGEPLTRVMLVFEAAEKAA